MRRLFRFVTRRRADIRADIHDEFAFHLDMRAAELRRAGLPAAEAQDQARQEFGDMRAGVRACVAEDEAAERRRGLGRLAAELRQDLAYGFRLIVRNKGFSAAAVLTLTVAIGGNTALFTVVNALFLEPLAIRAPREMVRIYTGESTVSWPNFDDIQQRSTAFSAVIAQGGTAMSLVLDPLPVRVSVGLVSMNYFAALGTAPLAGRTPQPDDRRADVAVLSERLWRTRLGGTPSIVGQTLTLNGHRYEVIGVMPRAFRGVAPPGFTRDLWIPIDARGTHRAWAADRSATRLEVFGRLKPGVDVASALASMRLVASHMASEHPEVNRRFTAMEVFAADGLNLYRGVGKALMPVFVFVGFLTVVAAFLLAASCANLAGLLLGRAAARRQEIAVRLSLGAGPGRLVRQLLTESLLLALIGGAGGLLLAWLTTAAAPIAAARFPFTVDLPLALDRRVLAYALGISTLSALFFGLAPARRATRFGLTRSPASDRAPGDPRQRFRQALIVGQVGISALLLFWSGLFGRSLLQANTVDPGFDASGVLLADVALQDELQDPGQHTDRLLVELQKRLRGLPEVRDSGWSSIVPLALTANERFRVSRADAAVGHPGTWVVASRLTPDWFGTVRIPLVAGRDFTWQDRLGAPRVAIVNETLARLLWSGQALGQRLKYGDTEVEVVGLVRDSKYWTLGEAISPAVYLPFRQGPMPAPPTLHVRTADRTAVTAQLRQWIQELAPGATVEVRSMQDAVAVAVLPARIGSLVTAAFGLLGALLATLGVYGLIAFIVVERSREVAIRRAIGAPTRHIIRVVVGSSAMLAGSGLVVGLALGALSAPLFGGLLVNVSPRDPLTMVATTLVVLLTAAAASTGPALRAARMDPLAVLRSE
jgi:predicted permease